MRDTWQSEGAPIVIGRLQLFAIGGTTRSSDFHRTAAIVRDLLDAHGAIMIGGSSSDGRDLARWEHRGSRSNLHPTAKMKTGLLSLRGNLERRILIRRRRRRVEEHHDHGPIGPRSRRDRAAIVIPGGRNHLPELRKVALEASDRGSTHDRGPITS